MYNRDMDKSFIINILKTAAASTVLSVLFWPFFTHGLNMIVAIGLAPLIFLGAVCLAVLIEKVRLMRISKILIVASIIVTFMVFGPAVAINNL